ncbi:MAG: hypothetical protein EOP43_01180 [Sphingobacteriaceae bacterium]|nr:MAG: hypothetical protein EOP43_01180 [Sphingobacteriaceae bacterium]
MILSRHKLSLCVFLIYLIIGFTAKAQTAGDAIMIPKSNFCSGLMFSNSSWNNYWEGTFKRVNGNIGSLNTNTVTVMGNYGITNRLNMLVSLPYMRTNASAGTLEGQHGLQDISVALKWVPFSVNSAYGKIRLFAVAAGSIPVSNYQADFMPMSIGLHCNSLVFRALADYQFGHLFFTGSGEYLRRDNITIDRTAYYTTEMHYTNQVAIPDGTGFAFRSGFRSSKLIAEAVVQNTITMGGFDIRKNDMPFPSNRMNATTAGVNFKYSFTGVQAIRGLELTGGGNFVVAGRNVGQSTSIYGGAFYIFNLNKKNTRI